MPDNTFGDGLYEVVDTLRNADGLVTTITKKKSTGAYSFSLMKEFDRGGQTDRSSYLQRRQIEGAIELLKLTAEKMDKLLDADRAAERARAEERQKERRRANNRGRA